MRMRQVRNGVRAWLTHDTSELTVLQQLRWYYGTYRPRYAQGTMRAYLLWANGIARGYGLLRAEEGRWWITGALDAGVRGRGLGRTLFEELTFYAMAWSGTAWLDVRRDNQIARKLYASMGFRVTEERGDILVMTCP